MRSVVLMIYITLVVFAAVGEVNAQGTPGYGANMFAGVKTDAAKYPLGEPVKVTFIVENRSDAPVTYQFSSGKQYDIWAEKDGKEIWRLSHGRMYTQALTSITLEPKASRSFTATWNQVDNNGKAVAPGAYTIKAQLTTMGQGEKCSAGGKMACVSTQITVGAAPPKVVNTRISSVVSNVSAFKGKLVSIDGTFRGWKADGNSSACKLGPPVSRSDWAVSDRTGCIYAYGKSGLDPVRDIGKKITVLGRVMVTKSGQPYLEVRNVNVQ